MRVPTLRIIEWEMGQPHQNGVSWRKIAITLIGPVVTKVALREIRSWANRGNMVFVKPHKRVQKQGIGLYTYDQSKNTTPFQYLGVLVGGTLVALLGIAFAYAQYQSRVRSTGGLIAAAFLIVVGIFWAHPGAIFWYRRLRKH
jgi:hypothetical protein